ncbi:MAG: phosphoserine phosphatase SerB [Acinetobacter sp.]
MQEITLISFLGSDQPNLLNRLMQILFTHSLQILDIQQTLIYDQISLTIVVAATSDHATTSAKNEIAILAQDIDLTVRFKPICNAEYQQSRTRVPSERYVATLIGAELTIQQIAKVVENLSKQGFIFEDIQTLTTQLHAQHPADQQPNRASIELKMTASQLVDAQHLKATCLTLADQLEIDVIIQKDHPFRTNRRLICFDMDSTLIGQEVIDELAKEAGIGDQVAEITERSMRGELDFQQSFKERVALLKGLDTVVLSQIADRLTINEGAYRLISTLKRLGYHTAILSGGFQYFAEYLQKKLGIDEVHANILDIRDGQVTGEVQGTIVDGARKAEILRQLAEKLNISLDQAIAVGDGANDLPMLAIAGLGVAYKAKPLVRETAQHALSHIGLDGVLYILGLHDQGIEQVSG